MALNFLKLSNALEKYDFSGDEDKLVSELEGFKSQRSSRKIREQILRDILYRAKSSKVRNAAAIAIADMRIADADKWIVETLDRPEVANSSGTLLYALSELKARAPIELLVKLIENGSYEARSESLMFFENKMFKYSNDTVKTKAILKLRDLSESSNNELSEVAQAALIYLDEAS